MYSVLKLDYKGIVKQHQTQTDAQGKDRLAEAGWKLMTSSEGPLSSLERLSKICFQEMVVLTNYFKRGQLHQFQFLPVWSADQGSRGYLGCRSRGGSKKLGPGSFKNGWA